MHKTAVDEGLKIVRLLDRLDHYERTTAGGIEVRIPFASKIIPTLNRVQARRDFQKICGLVETIAWIHQEHRTILSDKITGTQFLQATLSDYRIAFPLLQLCQQAMTDNHASEALHFVTFQNWLDGKETFSQRDIQEGTGIGRTRTKSVTNSWLEMELINVVRRTRGNRPGEYALTGKTPTGSSCFVTPDELEAKVALELNPA